MNAKKELLNELGNTLSIKCASIRFKEKEIILRVGHSHAEYDTFLENLNFDYDWSYGQQELYGIVWLNGDAWLERYEYDRSENWTLKSLPEIPSNLIAPVSSHSNDFKSLPSNNRLDGIQYLAKFPNGYGASIIMNQFSYGARKGLWELAVLDDEGDLCFDTPITDDVLGYLTEDDVNEILDRIEELPPCVSKNV